MSETDSLLEKLDASVPASLKEFDAFPKLPSSYKKRSEGRGVLTALVALAALLLLLNDLSEFAWGWADHEFSVDHERASVMNVNVDIVVNMPCGFLSVDLRDAVGDRLYLTSAFRRDGVTFDIGEATKLKEHAEMVSARDAVSQARRSRGLFAFWQSKPEFAPTYKHEPAASACRVFGNLIIKKVTANLHITALGHGYSSNVHVDHSQMNMSHVITEFSFGPFFPEITQPLDNSFEITHDPFVAYQYFMHIVPTTYIAPRAKPLSTNQYSVTHYTRQLDHGRGTPGIFFKFDMDPMSITIHQRTTSFLELIIRCVGVFGGIFTCMGYAIKVGSRAMEVVTGPDTSSELVGGASSSVSRSKWRGGSLHARSGSSAGSRVIRQGNAWVVEGSEPYGGSRAGTPLSGPLASPYLHSPYGAGSAPHTPLPGSAGVVPPPPPRTPGSGALGVGLGLASPAFGPHGSPAPGSAGFGPAPGMGSAPPSAPSTPAAGYTYFPPTPAPGQGFPGMGAPLPGSPHPAAAGGFGQRVPPPPPRSMSQTGPGTPGTPAFSKKAD